MTPRVMRDSGQDAAGPPPPALSLRALAALYAVAVVVRGAFLLLQPPTRLVADERVWTGLAAELAAPDVAFSPFAWTGLFHPPLYVYFIAAARAATGSLAGAAGAQAGFGALLAPLVGHAAALLRGPRAGLAAGLMAAFYPELVWYSGHFWSETLFVVLLWAALDRLLAARPAGPPAPLLAAGLLWGLATLTRETALYLLPVAAAWLAWPRTSRAWRGAALFTAAALAVVLPWTARNYALTGGLVPVATRGSFNLWLANTDADWAAVYAEYEAVPDGEIARERHAREQAAAAIRAKLPWWPFEKAWREVPAFWGVNDHLVVHVERGAYRIPLASRWGLALATVLAYVAVMVLALPSVMPAARERGFRLLLALLAAYLAMHVVAFASPRFRLPFVPLLFLLAASTLSFGWRASLRRHERPLDRLALVALALALATCVGASVRETFSHPAFRDTAGPRRTAVPVPAAACAAPGERRPS